MKFPYLGYTEKELKVMESYYFLQLGGDFVQSDDICTFTQKEITKLYNETLRDLVKLTEDGSEKDARYALDLIRSLRVVPVRLH